MLPQSSGEIRKVMQVVLVIHLGANEIRERAAKIAEYLKTVAKPLDVDQAMVFIPAEVFNPGDDTELVLDLETGTLWYRMAEVGRVSKRLCNWVAKIGWGKF